MRKRFDYRNHIKKLDKEGLIKYIDGCTGLLFVSIGLRDCTKLHKQISYAKSKLNNLNPVKC
jgi:hypothetical protein